MMDGRTAQRLRQEAWKRLSQEWKDDPEACFVLGFQAGLDAVAPRVEPPVTESGGGFESHPASVQEPVAVVSGYYGGQCVVLPTNPARLFNSGTAFYTTPPAAQPAPVQEPLSELEKDAANLLFALRDAWPYVHGHCTIESRKKAIQALMVKHGDFADLHPPAAQRQRVVFPTMLRKMWSGSEVQAWLDENVNKGNT